MTNTNITNFRKNIFEYVNQAIEYNDVININTKSGNAVIMSEEDYNGLIETLYIYSHKKTYEEIKEGAKTPIEECVKAEDVIW